MKKRILIALVVVLALAATASLVWADKPTGFDQRGNATSWVNSNGFDQDGWNYNARIFSGKFLGWCMGKLGWTEEQCRADPAYGPYVDDHLVMKWNAEWDRGNAELWANPPYDAWCDNHYNGMMPGGSEETWHYKNVWVGPCGPYGTPLPEGGYCIWGQFQVVMSHGTFNNAHFWDAHAIPSGHGVYP